MTKSTATHEHHIEEATTRHKHPRRKRKKKKKKKHLSINKNGPLDLASMLHTAKELDFIKGRLSIGL